MEKWAYLTANQMTIQEGRRAIAQALSDNRVKVRGLGCPHVNLLAQQPFQFNSLRNSPPKDVLRDDGSDYPWSPHRPSRGSKHNRRWRDRRPQSPRFPLPPQTMALTVIGDCYQQCLQCCQDEVDNTKKRHA